MIFLLTIGFFVFYGLVQILSAGLAPPKISRTIRNVSELDKTVSGSRGLQRKLAEFISGFLRLSREKREFLESELETAGLALTPEMYYADAASTLVLGLAVLLITAAFLNYTASLLTIVVLPPLLLVTVRETGKKLYAVGKIVREKRVRIEADLPRFVYCVANELGGSHDVLTILERHKSGFSAEFEREIAITIADMRSGSHEAALQRLESRVASAALSEVARGLIKMLRGDDSRIYWETLTIRFSEIQKQNLRRQAQKIPAKLRVLSFFLFITIGFLYAVIIGAVLAENMRQLF
jgi:hypothetical protein